MVIQHVYWRMRHFTGWWISTMSPGGDWPPTHSHHPSPAVVCRHAWNAHALNSVRQRDPPYVTLMESLLLSSISPHSFLPALSALAAPCLTELLHHQWMKGDKHFLQPHTRAVPSSFILDSCVEDDNPLVFSAKTFDLTQKIYYLDINSWNFSNIFFNYVRKYVLKF